MTAAIRILVVDDEEIIREGCRRALAHDDAYQVATAGSGSAGLELLKNEAFDVVLLDLMMPDVDGLIVLDWVKRNRPQTQVIVITGFATVPKAVEAMRGGAADFVAKPFTVEYLRLAVQRAVERRALLDETRKLREEKVSDLYAIVQEQTRLKTVLNCMEGAILVTNRDGKVVLHNPAVANVLKLRSEPAVGKHVSEVIDNPTVLKMINEVISSLAPLTREFEPGAVSSAYLRACCAPVHTATGKIFGSVTVFEDVSARKQAEQLKSEFVSILAHELRAPLAAIEQMLHALRSCAGEARREHFLNRIGQRTRGLLQMIENLLDLSRLDAGSVSFTPEPTRGDELVAAAVEIVRPRAEEKNVRLDQLRGEGECWIDVDPDQIRGVLVNVLDNAAKYTPPGGEVIVSTERQGALAMIRVADTGIGIQAEDLAHIFDRFYRVKGSATRGITGSGLGLSLAKRIVESHRGRIEVESQPSRGTTFKIVLPLAQPPPPRTAPGPEER